MITITAAYPAENGNRIVTFGPFEFAQFTYGLIRVGTADDSDIDFGTFENGAWHVYPQFITDGGPAEFSDLTIG